MTENRIDPLLVPASEAAAMLSVSRTKFYELHSAGRVPMPIRFDKRVLWRVEELRLWVQAGCPARIQWEKQKQIT